MKTITMQEEIPVKGSYDVIVAGAGVAGVAAALAAKRAGKTVLLLEKSLTLGGLATLGLINFFVPMCNRRGRQIVKGYLDEFVALSIRYGYDTVPEEWKHGDPGPSATHAYITRYSAQIFAVALTNLMMDEGVDLLLDTVVSKPVMNGTHCEGLVVENKSGREYYAAGMVVDATGDADVLYRAGVPTVQGKNFYTYIAHGVDFESCKKALDTGDIANVYRSFSGGGATLYGQRQMPGVRLFDGTTAQEVTEYVTTNQKIMLQKLAQDDRKTRDVVVMPGMPQFRTTRHIDGDYTMTVQDMYRHFDDSVGAINDFDHKDALFEVPLRALTCRAFDNLITAGRCAAGSGYMWDILRVIPPAILTGQAAGEACAQALDAGCAIADVDMPTLQAKLAKTGVIIHFDDAWVPMDGDAPEKGEDVGHM